MSSRGAESVFAIFVIVCAASIFWLSKELNLDFPTTAKSVGGSVLALGVSWFLKSSFSFELPLWPATCAFILFSWFPALDYWALQELPPFASRYSDISDAFFIPWYATSYFKSALFFAPLIYGYIVHPKIFPRY